VTSLHRHVLDGAGGWTKRPALLLLIAVALVALAAFGWRQAEEWACRDQVQGTGTAWVGANCGYRLSPGATEFRYAIDQGVERRLLLSGGAASEPSEIRVLRNGSVLVSAPTQSTARSHSDVCRNQPPADPRWWSAAVDDATAAAIEHGDLGEYRVEGLIAGEWTLLRLHASGCVWKGG